MKLKIKKSLTADTRSCDYKTVSKETLLKSTHQHIGDVQQAMQHFSKLILRAGAVHDRTKVEKIDDFHKGFVGGFEDTSWLDMHVTEERHHITTKEPEDIDLIDVLEYIADTSMAAMGRSGKYMSEDLAEGLLKKAFDNTLRKMLEVIEVEK